MWMLIGLMACTTATPAGGQVAPVETGIKQRFSTYRTFAVGVGGGPGGYYLRADHTGRFIFEGGEGNQRLLWDGTSLTADFADLMDPTPGPESLGPAADALMATLVAEMRAGFPTTAFIDELPSEIGYTRFEGAEKFSTWRRLDFAGPWDDALAIFVAINKKTGELNNLLVLNPDLTLARLPDEMGHLYLTFVRWEWDVPLQDDLDRLDAWGYEAVRLDSNKWQNVPVYDDGFGPEPYEQRMIPYHWRHDRYLPPFDAALSNGTTPPAPALAVESAYLLWEGTCTPNAVHAVPFKWVWRPDPDATDWSGVTSAVAGGCPIRVDMQPRGRAVLANGSKSRILGSFTVKDRATSPATVVGTRAIDMKRLGPTTDQSDIPLQVPIGAADPALLEIVLEGTATLTCGPTASTLVQRIGLAGLDDRTLPRLRWSGCMPVPPPRQ